ncbi:MAG: hypothetical protein II328_04620, partial [Clostridia bacterium]|nr:hypothetical protein [Clostridia bacterium]
MADLNNKKTVEEDDPIKKMLEKLRQSVAAPVADPASEVTPSSKENEKTKEKNSGKRQKPAAKEEETESIAPVDIFEAGLVAEILPQEEVSTPVATVQPPFEETAFLPEEDKSVIAEMSEETEEDDALFDDDLDDEDSVDDTVIAQFFASEEEVPANDEQSDAELEEPETLGADDLRTEVTAEEETFVIEEEPLEETQVDDGREYDVVSFEDLSFLDDAEEEKEEFVPTSVSKEFVDFLKEKEEETPAAVEAVGADGEDAVGEPIELVLDEDEVSKNEADLLFRPTPVQNLFIQAEGGEEKEELSLYDEPVSQPMSEEEMPVIPNEDNGYAVEVEVRQDAWYMPPVSQEEEPILPLAEEIVEPTVTAEEKEDKPVEEIAPTVSDATKPAASAVEDFFADD